MLRTRRAAFVFALLMAAAIAFEPLIHTHPLSQTTPAPCVVCVSTVGRITPLSVSPASPLMVVSAVAVLAPTVAAKTVYAPLPSRAPPAA